MDIVIHRVNRASELGSVDRRYGVEIDIRANGADLILNHNPFEGGDRLEDYIEIYRHGLVVLNIKESGIEEKVLRIVRGKGIERCFLLDVEFPYIYRASRAGERAIAIRYSEDEGLDTVLKYAGKVDWVWIDTISMLPLDTEVVKSLEPFKTCLVCPERWGRPRDIPAYAEEMKKLGFWPDAVMTAASYAGQWESLQPSSS